MLRRTFYFAGKPMPTGALLFDLPDYPHERWTAHLRKFLPTLDIRATVDAQTAADIAYCVAWKPAPGKLRGLPNLKIVFSMGAGVDGIVADPTYPRHIPLARVVDDTLAQAMSEYVVLSVLYWHRRLHDSIGLQRDKKWRQLPAPRAPQVRVGILGFGVLGHYQLSGWSATPKNVDGVRTFHGTSQLDAFLAQSDILVCLLPLTPDTRGILNAKTFAALPKDACVINAARGGHVVEDDLIKALDSGHLGGATLDVFSAEPLPATSPLWSHPKVVMTAHSAAFTDPESFMRQVATTIRRMDEGLAPENLVDFTRGY
jgi:glyoxylate/hydroxypyruvate reductase